VALFRRKVKQLTLENVPFPSNETTMSIVQDEALAAALKLCGLQHEVWQELVANLEDMGLNIAISSEIKQEMNLAIARLRASGEIALEVYELEEHQ
jgi:hypothetical protein